MNGIMNSNGLSGFINGKLIKNAQGELVLTTESRSIPVRLEGASIPLGEEVVFKFLRAEPGRLLLTPLSRWESLEATLPFLKNIPLAERGEWEILIKAAVQEELPLDQDVLSTLRKWSLTAEKSWGVKVAPRVFAFLIGKRLPVTPATVLWALYARYPSVQKEIWRQLAAARPGGEQAPGGTDIQGEGIRAQDILERFKGVMKVLSKTGAESSVFGKVAAEKEIYRWKEVLTHHQQLSGEAVSGKTPDDAAKLNQAIERPEGGNKGATGKDKSAAQFGEKLSAAEQSSAKGRAHAGEKMGARMTTNPDELMMDDGQRESADAQKLKENLSKAELLKSGTERNIDPREMWAEILRGSSRFLAGQAQADKALAQFIFCLFPHSDQEVRWESRQGDGAEQGEAGGYSFRLTYNSREFKEIEVVGALSRQGLDLLIGLEDPDNLRPYFADFKSFLNGQGWRVNRVQVIKTSRAEKTDPIPQRVDGWV